MHKVLYREIESTSYSQALVLIGDSKHYNIYWKDNTVGRKKSRSFLKGTEDKFLLQLTEEPARRVAMLHLVLINKDMMVRNVEFKGS